MKYEKPNLKASLFTLKDSLMAESISAVDSSSDDDDDSPNPSFETLSDAIDILFG